MADTEPRSRGYHAKKAEQNTFFPFKQLSWRLIERSLKDRWHISLVCLFWETSRRSKEVTRLSSASDRISGSIFLRALKISPWHHSSLRPWILSSVFFFLERKVPKKVLVMVVPPCGVAYLSRLGVRNPSRRLKAQSGKFSRARHSRKAASQWSVIYSQIYSCEVIVWSFCKQLMNCLWLNEVYRLIDWLIGTLYTTSWTSRWQFKPYKTNKINLVCFNNLFLTEVTHSGNTYQSECFKNRQYKRKRGFFVVQEILSF